MTTIEYLVPKNDLNSINFNQSNNLLNNNNNQTNSTKNSRGPNLSIDIKGINNNKNNNNNKDKKLIKSSNEISSSNLINQQQQQNQQNFEQESSNSSGEEEEEVEEVNSRNKNLNGGVLNGDDHDEVGEIEDQEDDSGSFSDSLSSSPSIPDEDIDFTLVYALHTFLATVDGQASVVKGDKLLLLDDSNSYWWLVRVLKTQAVGYIPAENIETPWERLARLNKHRNVDVSLTPL